jgi:2-dehydro-3-deoxyphosphogluconate aldolase/(4S)-4-hydroxy-2-oxoglutarate aldolase
MPDLPCVPTGGVDAGNAPEWIAAGATAVGVGASLTAAAEPAAAVDHLRNGIAAARTSRG